jgi:FHA domain
VTVPLVCGTRSSIPIAASVCLFTHNFFVTRHIDPSSGANAASLFATQTIKPADLQHARHMQVDIDLSHDTASKRLSRVQCLLEFDPEDGFILYNVGRQVAFVNGMEVAADCRLRLASLSLIELGGTCLFFVANLMAMQRLCLEPPPCPQALH